MIKTHKDTYTIFFFNDVPNWVNFSNIDKKTFYSFIEYLYSLERKMIVLPYICGGFVGPCRPVYDKDMTYKILNIVRDIENKIDVHKLLNHHFSDKNLATNKYCRIHFNEDIFEELISIGLNRDDAIRLIEDCKYRPNIKEVQYQLSNLSNVKRFKIKSFIKWLKSEPHIHCSRWMFIYMFRNEFKKFMNDKGYKVHPVGGWVLNDKNREYRLGLIDEEGELY